MKTQRSKRPTEKDLTKELFQMLFHFNNQLENYRTGDQRLDHEINSTIGSIDQLMDTILRSEID